MKQATGCFQTKTGLSFVLKEVISLNLKGIHHLTAVTANVRENYAFYTSVLGLRLVKRSVNQDDVSAYHLFYSGDKVGSPGNDLTFFDWNVPREQRGTQSIIRTGLRVSGADAVQWWHEWLTEKKVDHEAPQEIDGRNTILFEDFEGQRLAIIGDSAASDPHQAWEKSVVPSACQILGQGPITLSVPDLHNTDRVLTNVLNMRQVRSYSLPDRQTDRVYVYEMGDGGARAELHIAVQPDLKPARSGAGSVHHVAFRTPTFEEYHQWTERLKQFRIPNSGEVDRFWFRSLYFREPNGILFEIATDEPGFGIDEPLESLGESVVLPPFLEAHRATIVANLKPLK